MTSLVLFISEKDLHGTLLTDRRIFILVGLSISLFFMPGRQQKHLHFCTKPNKITENDSKKKIIMLNV